MSAGHADTDHDQARAVSATAMLVGLATLLLGVYSTLAVLSFRFGPQSVPAERPVLLMLGLLGIAFIAYLLSIRVALSSRQGMPLLATILLAGVLMRGVSLLAWPILEVDINRYIWDGAVVLEGVSPYRYSPAQVFVAAPHAHLPEDLRRLVELRDGSTSRQTILSRIHYRELPTIYPPVSQAVFAVAVFVTPANVSVLAHILIENTKPTNAADRARPPWFSITPESWKAQLLSRFSRWLGMERAEAAFFLTRLLTGIVFVVIALSLLSTSRSSDDPAVWLRVAFLTLAWFWLLSPTQNPWYWTWALPLVMFARSRVWLAVSGLAMIYYLRFWLVYHWPEQPVPGTAYTGAQLFDFVVTWLEYGPWFVCLAWVGIRARAIRES